MEILHGIKSNCIEFDVDAAEEIVELADELYNCIEEIDDEYSDDSSSSL